MSAPAELLYVGFRNQVVALRKTDGELIWEWKCPNGTGYTALLVEGTKVFVTVNGYTYALNAVTGEQLWYNPLDGYGTGTPCLATSTQSTTVLLPSADDDADLKRHRDKMNDD